MWFMALIENASIFYSGSNFKSKSFYSPEHIEILMHKLKFSLTPFFMLQAAILYTCTVTREVVFFKSLLIESEGSITKKTYV